MKNKNKNNNKDWNKNLHHKNLEFRSGYNLTGWICEAAQLITEIQ